MDKWINRSIDKSINGWMDGWPKVGFFSKLPPRIANHARGFFLLEFLTVPRARALHVPHSQLTPRCPAFPHTGIRCLASQSIHTREVSGGCNGSSPLTAYCLRGRARCTVSGSKQAGIGQAAWLTSSLLHHHNVSHLQLRQHGVRRHDVPGKAKRPRDVVRHHGRILGILLAIPRLRVRTDGVPLSHLRGVALPHEEIRPRVYHRYLPLLGWLRDFHDGRQPAVLAMQGRPELRDDALEDPMIEELRDFGLDRLRILLKGR
eukprot:scaffold7417_cov258-Pinguiococcus_pyrenoidosus.AAC.3